jgi:hypothetical protein
MLFPHGEISCIKFIGDFFGNPNSIATTKYENGHVQGPNNPKGENAESGNPFLPLGD